MPFSPEKRKCVENAWKDDEKRGTKGSVNATNRLFVEVNKNKKYAKFWYMF